MVSRVFYSSFYPIYLDAMSYKTLLLQPTRPWRSKMSVTKVSKPKPKGSQAAWQKLYDKVVGHPCFKLWLVDNDTTLDVFARQRHVFKQLREILEWCNRTWLLDKLEWKQRNGQMVNYLREHGFKASEIISLWSTEQLQAAFDELNDQNRGNGSRGAQLLGIADAPVGYRGKTRSHASAKKSRARNPEDRAADVANGRGKSLVDYSAVSRNRPNQQAGPVQRGVAVGGAGLSQKARSERAKKNPTRRGGGSN